MLIQVCKILPVWVKSGQLCLILAFLFSSPDNADPYLAHKIECICPDFESPRKLLVRFAWSISIISGKIGSFGSNG